MATKAALPQYKIADTSEVNQLGHSKWKAEKVKLGLKQAEDRSSLIPSEQVWHKLGLER